MLLVFTRTRFFAVLAASAALTAGCQLKSAAVPANFITVDPARFVLHNVDRFGDPQANDNSSMIVVVKATYTNPEANPEPISPDKFVLLDPNLMAEYSGLSGGNVNVPAMATTRLDPGKSIEIAVAFRVPASMSTARFAYRQ